MVGGMSLLGLPPLAGFASLWMGIEALSGGFAGGETVIFLAAVPLLIAGAMIAGTVALLLPRSGRKTALGLAAPAAVLLTACCAAVGLYPGAIMDYFMREYGLSLNVPFAYWTSLGWAALICTGLVLAAFMAWSRRMGACEGMEPRTERALPLLRAGWKFPLAPLQGKRFRAALVCGEVVLFLAWTGIMAYLGVL